MQLTSALTLFVLLKLGTTHSIEKLDQIPEKSFGGMHDECEALVISHKQYKSSFNIKATQSNFKIGVVHPKTITKNRKFGDKISPYLFCYVQCSI